MNARAGIFGLWARLAGGGVVQPGFFWLQRHPHAPPSPEPAPAPHNGQGGAQGANQAVSGQRGQSKPCVTRHDTHPHAPHSPEPAPAPHDGQGGPQSATQAVAGQTRANAEIRPAQPRTGTSTPQRARWAAGRDAGGFGARGPADAQGWQKRIAQRRIAALNMLDRLRRDGVPLMDARAAVVAHYAPGPGELTWCTVSALKRWGRAVQDQPRAHWPALLLPKDRAALAAQAIPRDAWVVFYSNYLARARITPQECHAMTCRAAQARPDWGELPGLDAFLYRLRKGGRP